jgi:hypothetical protein
MPNFQTFKKRMVPLAKQPYMTLQRRGTMSFNAAAHAALGMPQAVELLYDPDERIIGVRAVEPTVEHAYPLRSPGNTERSFILSGTAFTKYYGIDTTRSVRRPAYLEGDVLCVDLKDPGTEVTSNRTGTGRRDQAQAESDGQPSSI